MAENIRMPTVTLANTVSLTNKTWTTPVLLGVPAAAGAIGRDTTQLAESSFDNGMFGITSRVIVGGVGTQTLINSTGSDQDFTSLLTFPANTIFTSKAYRIRMIFENITGVSTVTLVFYLKLGSTKIYISRAVNITNSLTFSGLADYYVFGRDAAGSSANVSCALSSLSTHGAGFFNSGNNVDQPVGSIATNGTLALTPGLTYSGTGSTESCELQAWAVEELN